jgi:hypothetical protein
MNRRRDGVGSVGCWWVTVRVQQHHVRIRPSLHQPPFRRQRLANRCAASQEATHRSAVSGVWLVPSRGHLEAGAEVDLDPYAAAIVGPGA